MIERKQYLKKEINQRKKRRTNTDSYECRTCRKEIHPKVQIGNLNWCCDTAKKQLRKDLNIGN